MLTHRRHPVLERLAQAIELGVVQRTGDVHQEEVEHPFPDGGKGLGGHDLGDLGAEGGLGLPQGIATDHLTGLIPHRDVGGDVGAVRQYLGDPQAGGLGRHQQGGEQDRE